MPVTRAEKNVTITHGSSSATIYFFGATLTSWIVDGREMIFVSSKALLDGSKAVRGGIPLVFPHFGTVETSRLPQHGFARNSVWELGPVTETAEETTVALSLTPGQVPFALATLWPKKFQATYSVTLNGRDGKLRTSLQVTNTDSEPWEFTALLHTYFATPDVRTTGVQGLTGFPFTDKVAGGLRVEAETRDRVTIAGEVDRIYHGVKSEEVVIDAEGKNLVSIRTNLPDIVVWNIWTKAKDMADMGDEDYKHYICVEAGSVSKFITLKPQESWEGHQILASL
ncbi:galactose mutarotase-like domain-containing protein [Cladochytrium replicatum]|nr:galactose mutarotase-like domain-containing protein [Cladochytrium replicatum]